MKLSEYCFSEYYHQYLTIEADALTDICKDAIEVSEDDCYALCSAFVGYDGMTMFRILSIGPTWDECTKGIEDPAMLGVFAMDEVEECEARMVEPDYEMIEKNRPYLEIDEDTTTVDQEEIRTDHRLDDIRDPWYPDRIVCGIIAENALREYAMLAEKIKGPFLIGTLDEEPEIEIGVHMDDQIYALPYVLNGDFRVFALFAGREMNEMQKTAIDHILSETEKFGINFSGISMKN